MTCRSCCRRGHRTAAGAKTGAIRGRVVSTDGRAMPHAQVRACRGSAAGRAGRPPAPFPSVTSPRTTMDGSSFRIDGGIVPARGEAGYRLRQPDSPSPIAPPPLGVGPRSISRTARRASASTSRWRRWGAMNGRVFDELGEPLQGASVQLLQVRYQAGRRRLVAAGGAARLTDDLGRFRIYGRRAGQYIVSATSAVSQSAELPGYTRSYFPGTPNAERGAVRLDGAVAGTDRHRFLDVAREDGARFRGRC